MYIFDTSSLVVLFGNYYPDRFPTLWKKFDLLISNDQINSVREVKNEIAQFHSKDRLAEWAKHNPGIFQKPPMEELNFVNKIFTISHFREGMIRQEKILEGKPVADPFVIAKAYVQKGLLITEESYKENAAKIPNVCVHFDIKWTNLEGFMKKETWRF